MLQKSTKQFAHHGMSLHCDVYAEDDYPADNPVFLYFHGGGLVGWGRTAVPPWLIQICWQRKWTLISASYRLMPQTGSKGLLEDVFAAYEFARNWQAKSGEKRRVIVGGTSGGFFPCAVIGHHVKDKPVALFSIQGINSFRHNFFNSSKMLTPEPIEDSVVQPIIDGPLVVGETPAGDEKCFSLDMLRPDGSRNPVYEHPPAPASLDDPKNPENLRGMLYDYYTYKNAWVGMLGDIDPGYAWATEESAESQGRAQEWPPTVIIHGNSDVDVELAVSEAMRDSLGEEKVTLFVADGQEHLYELTRFIEDEAPGMEEVRKAVACLDKIVTAQNNAY